jgi:uracil-DNA glycosylase family 4
MSLDLDFRQRAMLQEMGVRVWLPQAAPDKPAVTAAPMADATATAANAAAAPLAVQAPRAPARPSAAIAIENIAIEAIQTIATARKVINPKVVVVKRATSATLAEGIADMDWEMLVDAVAHCEACKLCTGRRAPVFGAAEADAPRQADWLVLGEPPDEAEERAGAPFVDQVGQLLDNMLKAVGVSRRGEHGSATTAAYVTNVVKCRPAVVRNPEWQELATCENYLKREVTLVQPKVILAQGRVAAQSLLRGSLPEVTSVPLGKLRGQLYRYQGIPVVVSYHPTYLLRTPQDKARAWADLCLARDAVRRGL